MLDLLVSLLEEVEVADRGKKVVFLDYKVERVRRLEDALVLEQDSPEAGAEGPFEGHWNSAFGTRPLCSKQALLAARDVNRRLKK